MVTGAYIFLCTLVFAMSVAGCWLPAILVGLAAAALAYRYEIRWVWDHTRWSKATTPRPVPRPRAHLRTTKRG